MKNCLIFSLAFLFLLLSKVSNATHIVGGEMSYQYLGADSYLIKITAYRDCYNGVPPFDNPAFVGIFDSGNILDTSFQVPLKSFSSISDSLFNCFTSPVTGICYEKGIYEFKVVLPPQPGGYQVAYQRCCRSWGVSNVANIASTGFTCYASIPGSIYSNNSSPEFVNDPFSFQCVNTLFNYDHSAVDMDGDSIVYSLYAPFEGGSDSIPVPNPPSNPPYNPLSWLSGYSLSDIFGGGTSLAIDPVTGYLSGMAPSIGIYVYGVCAKEYRNGFYLGETKRDFQVHVIASTVIRDLSLEKSVEIFPNPVFDKATFRLKNNHEYDETRILIYNSIGVIVRSFDFPSSELIFEKEDLTAGIYFFHVVRNSGIVGVGKFAIE